MRFFNKVKLRFCWFIAGGIFTASITVLIGEPIKLGINKYFSKAQISCEVVSLSNLSNKNELEKYAKAEALDPFRLNIDDPLLDKYYIYKVKLVNKGISIIESVKFRILIGERFTKVLDIKHKVKLPRNKKLLISYSIPALKWNINNFQEGYEIKLTWGHDYCDYILGYNIYKSVCKDVGYGRVNEKLLKKNQYDLIVDNLSVSYFAIETIFKNGVRSQLSDPLKFPNVLAFQPLFDNVIWINSNIKPGEICRGTKKSPYHSLEQALEEENKASTFFVKNYKNKIVNMQNFINNYDDKIKVFYLDDLNFLKGEIDSDSEWRKDKDKKSIILSRYKMKQKYIFRAIFYWLF